MCSQSFDRLASTEMMTTFRGSAQLAILCSASSISFAPYKELYKNLHAQLRWNRSKFGQWTASTRYYYSQLRVERPGDVASWI